MHITTRQLLLSGIVALGLGGSRVGYGQTAQAGFGRNRIQYKQQEWKYMTSTNFDLYYGLGSEEAGRRTLRMAEAEFARITELIGYSPYNRIRIYLYDSPLRLSESNVGLEQTSSLLGGKTSFLKSIVEISYPGNQEALRVQVAQGLARSMIYDMMYGGSFTEAVQNSYLMMLPEWFVEGAIQYAAEGWSLQMDNLARDAARTGHLRRLAARQGDEAAWMGQSLWAYMADRYGRANVSNILNLTRIIRNEESAISNTLGTSFGRVLRDWRASFGAQAEGVLESHTALPESRLIETQIRDHEEVSGIAISPKGRSIAWASQLDGKFYAHIKDLKSGRRHTLWKQGERHQDTKAVPVSPAAFAGEQEVAVVHHRRGRTELLMLSLTGKVRYRFVLDDIDQVTGMAFSPDGKKGVIIASAHGQTDLFQINPRTGKIRQMTRDVADEADPVISAEGDEVFYARRQADTAMTGQPSGALWQIYRMPLASKAAASLAAKGPANLTQPLLHTELGLLALQDGDGLLNLVKPDTAGPGHAVTRYDHSLERTSLDKDGNLLALVHYDAEARLIRLDSLALLDPAQTEPTTWRLQHPLRKKATTGQAVGLRLLGPPKANAPAPLQPADTIPAGKASPALAGQAPTMAVQPAVAAPSPGLSLADSTPSVADQDIDIRNYVFEDERRGPKPAPTAPIAIYSSPAVMPGGNGGGGRYQTSANSSKAASMPPPSSPAETTADPTQRIGRQLIAREIIIPSVSIQGPYAALNRLSSNSVVTTFTVDPIRGWGGMIEGSLSDYFENHRIHVKVLPFLDLKSSLLQMEYLYLKHRVDFGAKAFRNSYYVNTESYTQKNYNYHYQVSASYPISRSARVSLSPFYSQTNYINLETTQVGGTVGDKVRGYLGGRVEFVYDNSFTSSTNIITGTRAKIYSETYQGMNRPKGSFSSVFIDIRRYQRVHKEITLAVRGAAGSFFGPAAKSYVLGGMDNWLFNSYAPRNGQPSDPVSTPGLAQEGLTDWFYNQFVTNLRGFDYNAMSGNRVLLMNAELRVPLIKYLYKGPIASNFLRNFQLVGFYDVGSAWSGKNIFTRDNSFNTSAPVTSGQFTITSINYRSPFLQGYGAGVRTMLLGYYVKFDVAWGQQDYKPAGRKYYLTLGYDF